MFAVTKEKIVIVEYEGGNVRSVENALRKVTTADIIISRNSLEIEQALCLILPGVGSFDSAALSLRKYGIEQSLMNQIVQNKKPVLAICVGMQILFEGSKEGAADGLGLIEGVLEKFEVPPPLTIPHYGWNDVRSHKDEWLFDNLSGNNDFYFAHSYYCDDANKHSIATCNYGIKFCAAIRKLNVVATQFHPEKSHKSGLSVIHNFINFAKRARDG